jgi:hypothetical protein
MAKVSLGQCCMSEVIGPAAANHTEKTLLHYGKVGHGTAEDRLDNI